ncbi:MAG: hypothetical protein E7J66_27050, partial [Klebsiella pneumoniae]|nr:hypothetical protein [Klebsiella pneumoniae]
QRRHSRKEKQEDSGQETGKTRRGNAGGASARPGFPGAAGARPFGAVGQVIPCPSGYLRSLLYFAN